MARILVTDDAAFMRMMLKNILTSGGHEIVAEAENGEQAVEQYGTHAPDIVTMDITMPVMDGIQAVRAIRAKDPNAKILMCSAMGQQNMVMDAVKAGAKGFIVKPFDSTKILNEITRLLNA
ncbi:response regulator [Alicyclobacillus ferrooxydans]|uniref:Chemotaxis protein CheY n=1 Tax=Alicyclobacillus ferrooxydans TaxID=471514 RepID=A0A0P9GT83_9BACL|nr:response regulator [Alicyclobacillus ferrooxydans]KPV44346.1 chemotaxis protein CheY [Alicyclobacillus ferrooxydans]